MKFLYIIVIVFLFIRRIKSFYSGKPAGLWILLPPHPWA